MANTNAPFGLRLLGRQNDATPSFGLGADPLKIAQDNAAVAAKGDLMLRLATGYVTPAVAIVPDTATGNSSVVGVFWGCQYLSIAQGKRVVSPFWPGGADTIVDADCQIIPMRGYPNARFVIQATLDPFVFEDIGENCNIGYAAPTIYGSWAKSGVTLDKATIGTSVNLPFRIVGLWSQYAAPGQPGTDNTSNYNWVVVEFNGMSETGNA